MLITRDKLEQIFYTSKVRYKFSDELIAGLNEYLPKYVKDIPMFLAQCGHESRFFQRKEENLNYSYERLLVIFHNDIDADMNGKISQSEKDFAHSLIGSPEKIANVVYANQNGNGNRYSGDGWKYRGRGYIQLTGRANYAGFLMWLKEPITGYTINNPLENPDILLDDKYALLSAIYFWDVNGINKLKTIESVTKRINGGLNGLDERKELYERAKRFV